MPHRAEGPRGRARLASRETSGGFMAAQKTYKSFRYRAKTTWTSARRATLSAAGRADISAGSPPEFKGEGDVWAPEELLVGSLNTCLLLTFLTLAQARGLRPAGYESEAEGLLENVEGTYRISEVTIRPKVALRTDADLEPARAVMEGVEAQCFISNSLKSKVNLIPEFVVAPAAP